MASPLFNESPSLKLKLATMLVAACVYRVNISWLSHTDHVMQGLNMVSHNHIAIFCLLPSLPPSINDLPILPLSRLMATLSTGETLSDVTVLNELGIDTDKSVTLLVQYTVGTDVQTPEKGQNTTADEGGTMDGSSTHPNHTPPDPTLGNQETTPPGTSQSRTGGSTLITSVKTGTEDTEILIKIERSQFKKPFLGGYRHRVSNVEYHNAAVQTLPRPRPRKQV